LIEAAKQALENAPNINLSRTGVVASFFLGCIDYSIRFYRQLDKDGRRFASPVLFPETVFNSPISHVVSTLGIGGPVYSQIGDKSSWATALRTAQCWLKNNTADHVLVIAGEDFDPHVVDIETLTASLQRLARKWSRKPPSRKPKAT
jgi:3-oxoacyl-(acyl-carrier-protein) synthase